MDGIDYGLFEADVCKACNEIYLTEKSSILIELIAKKLGMWGSEIIISNSFNHTDYIGHDAYVDIAQIFTKSYSNQEYITAANR